MTNIELDKKIEHEINRIEKKVDHIEHYMNERIDKVNNKLWAIILLLISLVLETGFHYLIK